jgi:hypothetical protein
MRRDGDCDWRNDPAAHSEWERRNRTLIIVPAAPVEHEEPARYEPALWDINTNVEPARRDWGSN